jgi:hypothetical protein
LLDAGITELLLRQVILVAQLQAVVAHCVHWGLLWRASFSTLSAAFQQCQTDALAVRTWDFTRRKLKTFQGLLPLLYFEANKPSCPVVLAQDAAGQSKPADQSSQQGVPLGPSAWL